MKQTFGFALFGGYLGLMTASLTVSMRIIYPFTAYTPLTSHADGTADFISSSVGVAGEGVFTVPVLVGVIVGGVVGVLTRLTGLVMRGPDRNCFVRVGVAGLVGAGIGVGLATTVAFGGLVRPAPDTGTVLAIYAGCGLLAYALALAAIYGVLRMSDDDPTVPTVKTAACALPIGGAAATGVGM
ncbi:hypothetical protein SAMN04488550_0493 [Gordonia malaquae]|uniref:Uncharacterized protein n=1 Tax=Gordonia malaquae NBRC 108250 TaxID=1223542 RepID=M3VAM5_GORML|nr:hypothetical protein [Gordonia malaquae]GAC78983.1 hypothetical protein GM1_005_01670 [Gordonia malaquae NBRC 108250]SEB61989.1 hypothetical protein SAMN04488550_0493 [Gordonia malaquae]